MAADGSPPAKKEKEKDKEREKDKEAKPAASKKVFSYKILYPKKESSCQIMMFKNNSSQTLFSRRNNEFVSRRCHVMIKGVSHKMF